MKTVLLSLGSKKGSPTLERDPGRESFSNTLSGSTLTREDLPFPSVSP